MYKLVLYFLISSSSTFCIRAPCLRMAAVFSFTGIESLYLCVCVCVCVYHKKALIRVRGSNGDATLTIVDGTGCGFGG